MTMAEDRQLSDVLRSLPVFAGSIPNLDLERIPEAPVDLVGIWLGDAIGAAVLEPHVMIASTTDGKDSRTRRCSS